MSESGGDGSAGKYAYDSAGRPAEAADVANNINYVVGACSDGIDTDGVCYAPNGSVAQIQNGTNLVSTYIYNTRFQPCWRNAFANFFRMNPAYWSLSEKDREPRGSIVLSVFPNPSQFVFTVA